MGNIINDRVGQFLVGHLKGFLFDELSDNFLEKNGFKDILTEVPVPVRRDDMNSISIKKICINMAFVIGCDVNFKYRDNYIAFIIKNYGKDFAKFLVQEGVDVASQNDYDYACILFRGAFLVDPDNVDAIYCYGRACSDTYSQGGSEEFVGSFKAEAIEAYEKTTIKRPDFAEAFYYLAFSYLNLGLYIKSQLTFKEFKSLSEKDLEELIKSKQEENTSNTEEHDIKIENIRNQVKEAEEWILKLQEPVHIEEGYNMVISGRFQEGIDILSRYTDREEYKHFWPIWYYLGVSYKELGLLEMSEISFLSVLRISPSNIDAMNELVEIYEKLGRKELVEKYTNKIKLVKENEALDREEIKKENSPSNNKYS
ncbi:tetratricopeptide repeat protein [Eubacteriales bacterium KG127]